MDIALACCVGHWQKLKKLHYSDVFKSWQVKKIEPDIRNLRDLAAPCSKIHNNNTSHAVYGANIV